MSSVVLATFGKSADLVLTFFSTNENKTKIEFLPQLLAVRDPLFLLLRLDRPKKTALKVGSSLVLFKSDS